MVPKKELVTIKGDPSGSDRLSPRCDVGGERPGRALNKQPLFSRTADLMFSKEDAD